MAGRTVSKRHVVADLAVPAAQPIANPSTLAVDLGETYLVKVEIMIPPGHAALTGVGVNYAGERILPWGSATDFFVADGELLALPVDFVVTAPITIVGFNLDVYEHTFYARLFVDDDLFLSPQTTTVAVVPIAAQVAGNN